MAIVFRWIIMLYVVDVVESQTNIFYNKDNWGGKKDEI